MLVFDIHVFRHDVGFYASALKRNYWARPYFETCSSFRFTRIPLLFDFLLWKSQLVP